MQHQKWTTKRLWSAQAWAACVALVLAVAVHPGATQGTLQRRAIGASPRTRAVAVGGHLRLVSQHASRDPEQEDLDIMLLSGAGDGKADSDAKPKGTKISKDKPKTASASDTNVSSNDDDDEDRKTLSQQIADGKYGLLQKELHERPAARPGILSYGGNPEVPRDTAQTLGGLEPDDIWLAEDHVLVLRGGAFPERGAVANGEPPWPPIDDYKAPPRQVKIPSRPKVPPPFPVRLVDNGPTQLLGANGSAPITLPGDGRPFFGPPPFPYGPPPPFGAFPPLGDAAPQGGPTNAHPSSGAATPAPAAGALPPAGAAIPPARNGSLYGRPPGAVRPTPPARRPGNSPPGNGAPFFPFPFHPAALSPRNGTGHFPQLPPGLFPPFPPPGAALGNRTRTPPFLPPPPGFFPPGAAFLPPPGSLNDTFDEDDPSIYYPPPYDFFYPKDNSTEVPPGPLVPGIILPPPPDFFAPLHSSTNSTMKTTTTTTTSTTTTKPPTTTSSTVPTTSTARTVPPRRKKPRPSASTAPPVDSVALNQVTTEAPLRVYGKLVPAAPTHVAVSTPTPISYVVVPVTDITVRAKPRRPVASADVDSNVVASPAPQSASAGDRAPKASFYFYEEPRVEQGHLSDVGVIKSQRGYYKDGYYFEPPVAAVETGAPSTTPKSASQQPAQATPAPARANVAAPVSPLYLDISVGKPGPSPAPPQAYYHVSTPAPPAQYYYYDAPAAKLQTTTPAPPLFFSVPARLTTSAPATYFNLPAKVPNSPNQYYNVPNTTPSPQYYSAPRKNTTPEPQYYSVPNKQTSPAPQYFRGSAKVSTPAQSYLKPQAPAFYEAKPAPYYNSPPRTPVDSLYYYVTGRPPGHQYSTPRTQQILQALQALQALRSNLQFYNAAAEAVPGASPTARPIYQFSYEANSAASAPAAAPVPASAPLAPQPPLPPPRPRPTAVPPSSTPRTVYEFSFENQQGPSGAASAYVTTPLPPIAVIATTPGPLGSFTTARPQHAYYTPQDERLFDDITKNFFTVFGQKLGGDPTTPMPAIVGASPSVPPAAVAPNVAAPSQEPVRSLEGDIAVNYRQPLPSIEPEAEFISYPLPGNGAHFYFLTPQAVYGNGSGRQRLRYRRRKTPR